MELKFSQMRSRPLICALVVAGFCLAVTPRLLGSELGHPPELDLVDTPERVSGQWAGRIVLGALLTFFVWKLLPYVLKFWQVLCGRAFLALVPFALPGLVRRTNGKVVTHRRTFPKAKKYVGVDTAVSVELDVRSEDRQKLQIGAETFDVVMTDSDASHAQARGELIGSHGGNVGHFSLKKGKGTRANELEMRLDLGDSTSIIRLVAKNGPVSSAPARRDEGLQDG